MAFKLLKKYRNNLLLIGQKNNRIRLFSSSDFVRFLFEGGLVDGRLYKRAGLEELVQLPSIDHFQGELVSITQLPTSRTLTLANHPARLLSHYLDTFIKSEQTKS